MPTNFVDKLRKLNNEYKQIVEDEKGMKLQARSAEEKAWRSWAKAELVKIFPAVRLQYEHDGGGMRCWYTLIVSW